MTNLSFPFARLMFGSLISATDPVATLAILGKRKSDPQLYSLIFGEVSVFKEFICCDLMVFVISPCSTTLLQSRSTSTCSAY